MCVAPPPPAHDDRQSWQGFQDHLYSWQSDPQGCKKELLMLFDSFNLAAKVEKDWEGLKGLGKALAVGSPGPCWGCSWP
jgi:hypothetical protein